jgi:type IV secretory pathway TraG/TraD family ATPase VirD4
MNRLNHRPSWLTRLGLSVMFVLAVAAGVVLSAVFVALFLVVALVFGGWLWWQTRRLRRQQGETFIEADYEVESEYEILEDRRPQEVVVEKKRSRQEYSRHL